MKIGKTLKTKFGRETLALQGRTFLTLETTISNNLWVLCREGIDVNKLLIMRLSFRRILSYTRLIIHRMLWR